MNWLETKLAEYEFRKWEASSMNGFLQGYKGYGGAISAMLSVLGAAAADWGAGTLSWTHALAAFGALSMAFSQFGTRAAVGRASAGSPANAGTVDTKPPPVG